MAETKSVIIGHSDRSETVPRVEPVKYWLPSARALGLEALPLYYAELNRAVSAHNLGRLDEAEPILDSLLSELSQVLTDEASNADGVAFHLLKGQVLSARGRTGERRGDDKLAKSMFKDAVAEFSQWIEQTADVSAQVYCDYGVSLFKLGRRKATVKALEVAKEKGGLSAEVYRYLGICYCEMSEFANAEDSFVNALKQDPGDFLTRQANARCLESQGRTSEAVSEYNHVVLSLSTARRFEEAETIARHMMELEPEDPRVLVRIGEAFLASGRFEKVLETLDEGLKKQPANAGAIRIKGLAFFALGRYKEAVKEFQQSLKLDPTLYKARIKLASALYNLADFKGALKVLDDALSISPDDPEALVDRANVLTALDRNEEALVELDKALKIVPKSARALGIKGQILSELKQYRKAADFLSRSVNLNPNPTVYATLGQVLSSLDKNEEALEALDKALAIQPDYAPALMYKGEALRGLNRNEEALQALTQALALLPYDAWGLGTKGQVLRRLGMNEEAVVVLQSCLVIDPSLMWAHGELITALYALGRFEETLEALDEALAREMFSNWLIFKGQVLNEIAEFKLALYAIEQAIEQGIELTAEKAQAYGIKGWALENLGSEHGQEALKTYESAKELEPANLMWRVGVANAFYLMGDLEAGANAYRRALKKAETLKEGQRQADRLALMAWCEYRLANSSRAVKLFGQALSAEPDFIPNVFNLALVLTATERCEDALREYRRALRLVEAKPPLARRGLIWVALDDLDLAINRKVSRDVPEVFESRTLLKKALDELKGYQGSKSIRS